MKSKILGLFLFLLFYAIAYTIGYFTSRLFNNIYLKLLIFDLIATFVIYIFSMIIDNASLYDAYWSLTPFVMITYLFIKADINIYSIIFYVIFIIWSFRLTINWVITYKDFRWVDWRYKMYKAKFPHLWFLVNLVGIQVMPTLFVLVAFLPIIPILEIELSALSIIGFVIMTIGISLEILSDHQMHMFLKNDTNKEVCQRGLWKYSRHPNYLGEILVWFGVYITLILSDISKWYYLGFVVMIFLFEIISIPLMEKRQLERRSGYLDYKMKTNRLLLLPKKR